MSLASLVAEVYQLTNRPDLVAQTTQAVKMATLKAHSSDFYSRDLVEVNRVTASLLSQFAIATTFLPRFRALHTAQKSELVRQIRQPYKFFGILGADDLVDAYERYRLDVTWLVGNNLNFRTSSPLTHVYLTYYTYPDVTDATFNSWIDQVQPHAIICEAARTMFKTLGYDAESSTYTALVSEQLAMLKMSNITVRGC